MLPIFDEILEVLSDGQYHRFEDLKARVKLNETQVEVVLSFLASFGFVKLQRRRWSTRTAGARLMPEMANFLKRLKELGE